MSPPIAMSLKSMCRSAFGGGVLLHSFKFSQISCVVKSVANMRTNSVVYVSMKSVHSFCSFCGKCVHKPSKVSIILSRDVSLCRISLTACTASKQSGQRSVPEFFVSICTFIVAGANTSTSLGGCGQICKRGHTWLGSIS